MPWMRKSLRTVSVGCAPLASHARTFSSSTLIVDGSVWAMYWPTISMTRPSRGERWSAATMRQIGSFLPPTRVSLSRTATGFLSKFGRSRLASLPHERPEVGHLAAAELLHDLAHLAELLDELVDRLDVGAGPPRDAQAPRSLDELRPPALLRRHRQDDRLDAVELALIDLQALELLAGEAGHHPQQRGQRAHLADLLQLGEEVLEGELVAAHLALELLGLVLVELLLGLLDEAQDVAHPEDALGHAVGMEALELHELLADGGEEDRLAGDRLDRQRSAAAGVAVELGHHDAVELHGLGELLGDVDGVLAGHRVDDEQDVGRLDDLADAHELVHELGVDVQAASRIDDQDVLALLFGPVERPRGDVDRVALGALLVDVDARLPADLHELLHSGRAVDVAGGDGDR